MTAFLQFLSIALALAATGSFLMSGFMLAPEVPGRRGARFGVRQLLHGLAVFWLIAGFVAMRYPAAVISPVSVFFAAAFALGGFAVLAWVLRHRPVRGPGPGRRDI